MVVLGCLAAFCYGKRISKGQYPSAPGAVGGRPGLRRQVSPEEEREADSEYSRQAGRCSSASHATALDALVEKLSVLEEHLGRHAYCCGERMGVDDVMRFVVLQILFVNLGELWGMTAPAFARLPHVARWMGDMGAKASNPFRYVHDNEVYGCTIGFFLLRACGSRGSERTYKG